MAWCGAGGNALECHAFESAMHAKHFDQAAARPGWNFVKAMSGLKTEQSMSKKALTYTVAILLEAGSETTANAIKTFVLAARLYPRIIDLAQAELDSVIVPDRLPTIDDSPLLPYINAIVKETLRWHPVTPESVPHLNTQEDEGDAIEHAAFGFGRRVCSQAHFLQLDVPQYCASLLGVQHWSQAG